MAHTLPVDGQAFTYRRTASPAVPAAPDLAQGLSRLLGMIADQDHFRGN